ncbi:MAG TPA: FRG domain-containing protein [Legionella sp.]|nr:FRG domain-containing protein [Legionella sp.]
MRNLELGNLSLTDTNLACYKNLKLRNLNHFENFISRNHKIFNDCYYRGQQQTAWKLEPSIFRKADNIWEKRRDALETHLRNFLLSARGKCSLSFPFEVPGTSEDEIQMKWWALGQHYGLKTPLLDFVLSPYVALFYSFEKKEEEHITERAIFILDMNRIHGLEGTNHFTESNYIRRVDTLSHENARLIAQKGELIYIPDNIEPKYRTIESSLESFYEKHFEAVGNEILLLKMILPSMDRQSILQKCDQMNINRQTLFPDLTGASEYCNYLISLHKG